jgi:hypothetical protein
LWQENIISFIYLPFPFHLGPRVGIPIAFFPRKLSEKISEPQTEKPKVKENNQCIVILDQSLEGFL